MSFIRKLLIFFIGCFLLLLIVSPYVMGYLTEKELEKVAECLPTAWRAKVTLQSYERGWFHSEAKYLISLDDTGLITKSYQQYQHANKNQTMNPLRLVLTEKITHGPIILEHANYDYGSFSVHFGVALIQGELGTEESGALALENFLEKQVIMHGQALLYYDGAMELHLNSKKQTFHDKDRNVTLGWQNLALEMHLSRDLKKLKGRTTLARLSFNVDNKAVHISDLELDNQYQEGQFGLWFGKTELKLPFLTLAVDGKDTFILQGANLKTDTYLEGDVVDSSLDLELEKLILDEFEYGPGSYRVVIHNLDAQALSQLNLLAEEASLSEPDRKKRVERETLNLLPRLFGRGLQLQLSPFELETAEGELDLQAWLTLPNVHDVDSESLQALLTQADASMVISLPKPVVKKWLHRAMKRRAENQTEAVIAQEVDKEIKILLAEERITEEAGHYNFSAVYKQGQLYLNSVPIGKVLPLSS